MGLVVGAGREVELWDGGVSQVLPVYTVAPGHCLMNTMLEP